MATSTLQRLNGLCFLVGCAVLIIGTVMHALAVNDLTDPLLAAGWFVMALGAILIVVGLPGSYAQQARWGGLLGLLGFIGIIYFFLIIGIFAGLLHGLVLPGLATQVSGLDNLKPGSVEILLLSGAILGTLGSLLLGISTIRAGILPRWTGALIIVGGLTMFFGHGLPFHIEDAGLIIMVIGLSGMGWRLLSEVAPPQANSGVELAGSRAGGI